MRNRFKPNLAPRAGQRTTKTTAVEAQSSVKTLAREAPSTTVENSAVSPRQETDAETQAIESTNPDTSSTGDAVEQDSLGTTQAVSTSSLQSGPTRRSRTRVRPSVPSAVRQRQSGATPRDIRELVDTRGTHTDETADRTVVPSVLSSSHESCQSSNNHTTEARTTAGLSVTETECQAQPVATEKGSLEENLSGGESTLRQPANSSSFAKEQSSGSSQLPRRKRPLPNLPSSTSQKKRSSAVLREASEKLAQQEENIIETSAEEASVSYDKEQNQGNRKRKHGVTEEDNLDEENRAGAASQESEARRVEGGDDAHLKKAKAKCKRVSKLFKPRDPTDISKMTMQDLIYYNPKTNPMKSSLDARKKMQGSKKNSKSKTDDGSRGGNEETCELDATESEAAATPAEDEPRAPRAAEDTQDGSTENASVAPQVKIGADGSIILDEESLVIHAQEDNSLDNSEIVYEDTNQVNFAAYKKHKKVERWSLEETLVFYKALSQVGTDFSLMGPIFPKRTRRELKAKFKREEKLHREQIEKALRHRAPIDVELFAPQVEGEELDGDVAPLLTEEQ